MQAWLVSAELAGTWKLVAWRRIAEDGTISYPLGADASGLLVYTTNGRMAVQIAATHRASMATNDPLDGDVQQRADAYSTCLAYAGTYELRGESVVHRIDVSLFPNWAGAEQIRPLTFDGDELVLRTPPADSANGVIVNELSWTRERC
jgi:hypothetical protein